jgi:Cu(I)/Ag(I) efflux system membrane fusion protein
MHPQIRQPMPGRCPICGMELVPAAAGGANLDELAVNIDPAQRRLANIQTAAVQESPLSEELRAIGILAIDESRQATISAYIAGRLERLFADYTGVDIAKGNHLAVIYSPQLYAAQVDYLEARRAAGVAGALPAVRQAQEALAANTRQRLREYGMTDEQIAELERSGQAQSRLTIYAPQGGTVIEKLAIEGNYVEAGEPIYRIADLSTVWLMLELFPEDATRVRYAQRVEAVMQSQPGQPLVGRVAFIEPTVDPKTRTVSVRVELVNGHRRLRPGDYARARISLPIGPQGATFDADLAGKWISPMHPQIIRDEAGQCPICGMDLVPTSRYGFAGEPVPQPLALSVPRSAVLLAGGSSVVYVETEPGRFEIRPVTVGPILRDRIVILSGLKAGEMVATAGNFLIDSQMQLAGKPSLIDPARAIAKAGEKKGPLKFDQIAIQPVAGQAGQTLEALYVAYFDVQRALAADKTPPAPAAVALHKAAGELSADAQLGEAPRKLLGEIAGKTEHLHHLDVPAARKAIVPVSQAVVTLAAQVRSDQAQSAFTHFFCPMVPGGGDWIQVGEKPFNPFMGVQMQQCGERVEQLPPRQSKPPIQAAPQGDVSPAPSAAPLPAKEGR